MSTILIIPSHFYFLRKQVSFAADFLYREVAAKCYFLRRQVSFAADFLYREVAGKCNPLSPQKTGTVIDAACVGGDMQS